MKQRILIILFNIGKAQEHEWFVEYMDGGRFQFHFVLINGGGGPMHTFLNEKGIECSVIPYGGKQDLPALTWKLYRLMRKGKYDVVHCHLFEAALAGITAAWLAGVPKRIVTRHYSDYHHEYSPSAVKFDRWINARATHLVAVSAHVADILVNREQVPAEKVRIIRHGIDISDYKPGAVAPDRISALKMKYRIGNQHPVIGVISKCIEWKGHSYILEAFGTLLKHYPDAVLFMANFKGPLKEEIERQLAGFPSDNFRTVPFENDVAGMYHLFDCFVHVPVSPTIEAFGQVYIEALAARVPSVFTRSGIAHELAVDGQTCLVVPYRDSHAIATAVQRILTDESLRSTLKNQGYRVIEEKFDVAVKYRLIAELYAS